jgi:hypothetical protein
VDVFFKEPWQNRQVELFLATGLSHQHQGQALVAFMRWSVSDMEEEASKKKREERKTQVSKSLELTHDRGI